MISQQEGRERIDCVLSRTSLALIFNDRSRGMIGIVEKRTGWKHTVRMGFIAAREMDSVLRGRVGEVHCVCLVG